MKNPRVRWRLSLLLIEGAPPGGCTLVLEHSAAESASFDLKRWRLTAGAPTPSELADVLASLSNEANDRVLLSTGVQGVLGG